jgi:dihydrofolate reductase
MSMPKIIVYIATSLDGHIAREDGSIDWLPKSAESGYDVFYKSVDTVIMGKTTYEQVLTFGEYPYKDKKSFVFTTTNHIKGENVEFVSDVDKFIADGFPGVGKNVWLIGGAQIIASFLKQKAVNEVIVTIIPVPILIPLDLPEICFEIPPTIILEIPVTSKTIPKSIT